MRFVNVVLNALHLLGLICFMVLGSVLLSASVSNKLHMQIERLIDGLKGLLNPKAMAFIGLFFILYGCLILGLILLGLKNVYLRVACKAPKVLIDQSIVHAYVDDYFKKLFCEPAPYFNLVFLENQKLEIHTKIPDSMDKMAVIQQIENELGLLLSRKLGYKDEFILSLHEA